MGGLAAAVSVDVDDAEDSAEAESVAVPGAAFLAGVEGRLAFFLVAGGGEDEAGGAAAGLGLGAVGGVWIATAADVLCCGICESKR